MKASNSFSCKYRSETPFKCDNVNAKLSKLGALLNRKFHISQISHCEELVPIRHIFHTNISHFVKFVHLVKIYLLYN